MKKTIKLVLLAVLLAVICLCPIQLFALDKGTNTAEIPVPAAQITLLNDVYLASDMLLITEKTHVPPSPAVPMILFMALLCALLSPAVSLIRLARSFIPILRYLQILYPVKYKSKYLGALPVLL